MNLAVSSGDDRADVEQNRDVLLDRLGFPRGAMAIAGQVHGSRVAMVDGPGLVPETDGLVTQTPGLLLAMVAADCAVVLIVDDDATVVGAAHAGWRGTVGGVVEALLSRLADTGAAPDALRAWVSPCISQRRFEVGPEVAERFSAEFVSVNPDTGKHHVDLAGAIRARLTESGIPPGRIFVDGRCTVERPDLFYSYRGQRGRTGRMMGFIGLPA